MIDQFLADLEFDAFTKMDLTIVIPTYNRMDLLSRLLDSIVFAFSRIQTSIVYEVLVVDDGSTDGTECISDSHSVRLHRIQNSGPATARNVGIEAASGKLMLFLDDDCVVDSNLGNAIGEILGEIESFDIGCGVIQYFSHRSSLIARYLSETRFLGQGAQVQSGGGLENAIFPTACLLVSKAFLDSTGLRFEEGFPGPGGEDDLFSIEAQRKGGRFKKFTELIVFHDNTCTFAQFVGRYFCYGYGHVLVCRYGRIPFRTYSIWERKEILFWLYYPVFILRCAAKYVRRYRSVNPAFIILWCLQKTCVRIGNFSALRSRVGTHSWPA